MTSADRAPTTSLRQKGVASALPVAVLTVSALLLLLKGVGEVARLARQTGTWTVHVPVMATPEMPASGWGQEGVPVGELNPFEAGDGQASLWLQDTDS